MYMKKKDYKSPSFKVNPNGIYLYGNNIGRLWVESVPWKLVCWTDTGRRAIIPVMDASVLREPDSLQIFNYLSREERDFTHIFVSPDYTIFHDKDCKVWRICVEGIRLPEWANSLEEALLLGMAYKYNRSTDSAKYAARVLRIPEEK